MPLAIVTHAEASATLTVVVCDDVTMLSSLEEETGNKAEKRALPHGGPTTDLLAPAKGFERTRPTRLALNVARGARPYRGRHPDAQRA